MRISVEGRSSAREESRDARSESELAGRRGPAAFERALVNTGILYVRMVVVVFVGLLTSRILINSLGVSDYGLYNIIVGLVAVAAFINPAMAGTIQRFLSYELGRGDEVRASQVLRASKLLLLGVAGCVLLIAETVGLWYLKDKLVIPAERSADALLVYQFTVFTCIAGVIKIPFEAHVVAEEKMAIIAYVSLAEGVLKLSAAVAVERAGGRGLVLLSALVLCVSLVVLIIYYGLCRRLSASATTACCHTEARKICRELMSFTGWSALGGFANVAALHGVNLILNAFGGVVLNAAMAIANQVYTAVFLLVSNFQTALNPQITKTYASGQTDEFVGLVFRSARVSFFLLSILAIPIFVNAPELLAFWLGEVPSHAVLFVRLSLGLMVITAVNGPLYMAVQSTGNIRNYQLIISAVNICNLPLAYCALKVGLNPASAIVINLVVNSVLTLCRLGYLAYAVRFPAIRFLCGVVGRAVIVVLAGVPLAYTGKVVPHSSNIGLALELAIAMLAVLVVAFSIGLDQGDRRFVGSKAREIYDSAVATVSDRCGTRRGV